MTETLYSSDMLNTPAGLVLAGIIGYFFGSFLEKAGFGSSRKLTGIFYFRDMAVFKVMFTAVVTALVGYHYMVAFGMIEPGNVYALDTFWSAQIVGGLVFGVGFVTGGWCPGTAFVGLASAKWDALVFLVGAGIGSVLFNELFPLFSGLHNAAHVGIIYLPESLGIAPRVFPLLLSAVAVGGFAGCAWLEKAFGNKPMPDDDTARRRRSAAILLLLLAAGLIVVPPPRPSADTALDLVQTMPFVEEVLREDDHIDPAELAELIMSGKDDLLVVDIRPANAFKQFHLRGAVNMELKELASNVSQLPSDKDIVLYSNGTTHAAQTWLELRHLGWTRVRILTDGILGFWRECLTPPSLAGVMDESLARTLLAGYRARRTYFVDGEPGNGAARSSSTRARQNTSPERRAMKLVPGISLGP